MDFTIFLYIPRSEIGNQLGRGNEISLSPTYYAWEGLGTFGLGQAECKSRLFVRPSSVLVSGYRYTIGRDFAKATLALGGESPSISIRINNLERRRILRVIQQDEKDLTKTL